jgi:hypothetical protein
MSWLDAFFAGVTTIQVAGVPLPAERILNLTGTGVSSGVDDPLNGRTTVTFTAGGGGGGGGTTSGVTNTSGTIAIANATNKYRANGTVSYTLPVSTTDGEWHSVNILGGTVTVTATGNIIMRPDNGALVSTFTFSIVGGSYGWWWDNTDGLWIPM